MSGDFKFTPQQLKDTIEMIQKIANTGEMKMLKKESDKLYRMKMRSIFPYFSSECNRLFNMVIRGDNMNRMKDFYEMMEIKDKQERFLKGVQVGKDLANEYAYSVLPKDIVDDAKARVEEMAKEGPINLEEIDESRIETSVSKVI